MSSSSAITTSSGDFETITIVTPQITGNRATIEKAIVQDLAAESSVDTDSQGNPLATTISGKIARYDSTTAGKINTSDLSGDTRKQFEISTTTTNDGRFSLLSEFQTVDVSNPSSFVLTVAGNSKTTTIVQPSTSWADSCLKIDISGNYGPFDDLSNAADNAGANFVATFDSAGANVDSIKAVNSQFSTSDNSRPLQIVEANFNSNALGSDQSNWYAEDTSGNPVATAILSANNLEDNSYLTTMTDSYASFDFSNTNDIRFGTFKFDREPQKPLITINEDASVTNSADDLPFQSLPVNTLTEDQFFSIFDIANNVIAPGYKFDVSANDLGSSSGYGFGSVSTKSDGDSGITLDDSGLKNNATYMASWVTKNHSLEIAKPTFNITAVDNNNTVNVAGLTLSSGYETLTAANNNDGQIMINKHSTADDDRIAYVTPLANAAVNVYYQGEDNTKTNIVSADQSNSYVEYSARKVLQQPLSSKYVGTVAGAFMTSGNAALNLYSSNGIANTSFNTNKFDFNFTSGDNDVAVFKVSGSKPLTDINGLLKTSGNAVVTGVAVSSVLKNFNGLMSSNTFFANSKINFTSKPLADLSFVNAVSDDWVLSGTDCKTNSSIAFNQDDCKVWPKYNDVIDALTNNYSIDVSMSVITGTSGGAYALQDKVKIEYSVNGHTQTVNVNQSDLTFEDQTKMSDNTIVISSSTYNVDGPLVGRNIQLEQHTVVRKYRYGLKLNIRPYENLTAKTPYVGSETIMYKVKDLATDKYYSSMYLKYVTMGSTSLIATETIYAWDGTQELAYEFTIQPNDFKSLNAIIVGTNTAGTSANLTASTPIDPYYGIDTVMELLSDFETTSATGDVLVVMNCDYLDSSDQLQNVVTFLASDSWYVTLIPDYAIDYAVTNFNSSYADLATNTDIDNDTNILSVDDAFANITTWNTAYKVVVTYSAGVTKLSIQNSSNVEKFYINLKDDTSLVTTAIVSYSLYDAYRCVKQIGNVAPYTSSTWFMSVDQSKSAYELTSGVYVHTVTGLLSSVANGAIIDFTLKGDDCGVNMVGSVSSLSELTYASGLSFQYTNGAEYSRSLSLPFYRGYQGVQTNNQVYTINRGKLNVIFTIADTNNSVQTISSVYDGLSGVAINNLSQSVGDIGLNLSFSYSLLADSVYTNGTLSIPIVNAGDTVTFSIVNPNGTAQTVPSASTLKTRTLYTFSGANFNSTGSPLVIRSYRLKVNSSEFSDLSSGDWNIELLDSNVKVYYSSDYLGNPTGLTYGSDPVETALVTTVMKGVGITINGWNVKIDDTVSSGSSTSYWSMLPPYLKFSQTVYAAAVTLPYTAGSLAMSVQYLPVSSSDTYNPFSSTSQINNITYEDWREKSVSDYINDANTTPYEIYVEGNTYTINYCLGLQSGSNSPAPVLPNPLFSGPANRLMDVTAGSSIFWTNASSSNNSVVKMNFLQPTISQIYTAAQLTGESPIDPNILVQFGTFFYSATTKYLNLPTGDGVKTYLYTRVVEKSETTDVYDDIYANFKITLYKYTPVNLSDWNNQISSKQITLAYSTREYYEHTVSIELGSGANVQTYLTEIRKSMPLNSITWTADTTYNNSSTTDYVTVNFLSQNAKIEIPALLWTVSTANNNSKGVIVNQAPLFNILNKIGYSIMAIYNNGIVNTSALSLTP